MDKNHLSLLGLPAEIRQEIYKTLMVSQDEIGPFERHKPGQSSQLLRVCRQICQEALPVLYGQNVIGIYSSNFGNLRRSVGDHNMAQMTNLRLYSSVPFRSRSHLPPQSDLLSAADVNAFQSLRVLECVLRHMDGPVDSHHFLEARSALKALADRPDLPNLDQVSIGVRKGGVSKATICRLDRSNKQ